AYGVHADPPGGRGGAGRPLRHQGVPRHGPRFGAGAAGDVGPDDQGLGGVGPGGVNLRPSGPRPLPGSAGTTPLRYRSTGEKSWRRKDRVASALPCSATAPPGEKSGATSVLVEPAGDVEERLDEVFAMPRRDDMGHLVGDRPRVGRTTDQDLPARRDVDTALA